jgi:hypothetical protein
MSESALAAIVFGQDENVDALMQELLQRLTARGVRVGGLIQSPCDETVMATHIESGRRIDLMQNLGACSEGCRLDTGALAEAAGLLAQSLAAPPQLLLISRFGHAEVQGGGFLAEIGEAASRDIPTLIGVGEKRCVQWAEFAGDLSDTLPCSLEAALAWWDTIKLEA